MEFIRAFIAINLGHTVQRRLKKFMDELRAARADVRWVQPENLHLTLAFLGRLDTAKIEPLETALRRHVQPMKAFDLEVRGTGVFGRRSRPNVVWAGLNECSALFELQQRVIRALHQAEAGYDERPFRPHLTLGRFKSLNQAEQLFRTLEQARDRSFGTARIASAETFRSELNPDGAVHTVLHSIPFAEG